MAEMQIVPGSRGSQAADEQLQLVGRLRRWHRKREWGFIFSELHNCDVFLDGANNEGSSGLSEGDLVLFDLWTTEEGLSARNVRRAELQEVEQQQVLLAPVYQQHALHAQQVGELPRIADGQAAAASSGSSARGPQHDAGVGAQALAATPRLLEALRRPPPPPPPPPPTHPAPTTGPRGFAPQALSNTGMLQHQQPYVAQPGYGSFPSYNGDRGFAAAGMYQQGHWSNGEAMLGTGSPAAMASQSLGTRLLLEPPHMLARLDPKAMAAALKGGPWPGRRGQTFRSSRSGTATQIGQEWCEILRQACSAAEQQSDDAERPQPQASAAWGGEEQWMWPGTNAAGSMDTAHGTVDVYSSASPMGSPAGVPHVMLGMSGDGGIYATTSAT